MHIKDPMLLIGKLVVFAAGFLLLSEWFFTICPMPVELTDIFESIHVELSPVKAVLMMCFSLVFLLW